MAREYDSFGPWILEIGEEYPVPPLFRSHYPQGEPPAMAFKIPRDIDRRDATPDMDLYEYVVCLFEDSMLVLERTGTDALSHRISFHEVEALKIREDLLLGYLEVHVAKGSFSLPFNASSREIIDKAASFIRARYASQAERASEGLKGIDSCQRMSFYCQKLLGSLQRQNPARIALAYQKAVPVSSSTDSFLRRLISLVQGLGIAESMHVVDGKELIACDRGGTIVKRRRGGNARDMLHIPLDRIKALSWEPSSEYGEIMLLRVSTSHASFDFAFEKANEDARSYAAALSALSGAPS